jgi:hypothetical protein
MPQDRVDNNALVERRMKRGIEELENNNHSSALDFFDDAIARSGGAPLRNLQLFRAICVARL